MTSQPNRAAQRRARVRDNLWNQAKDYWPQPNSVGWCKLSKITPLALLILEEAVECKGATRVYLDLLTRNFNEGIVERINESEAALLSGFSGASKERGWKKCILLLDKFGFIRIAKVGSDKLGVIFIIDPVEVIKNLHTQGVVSDELWNLFIFKCADSGIPLTKIAITEKDK